MQARLKIYNTYRHKASGHINREKYGDNGDYGAVVGKVLVDLLQIHSHPARLLREMSRLLVQLRRFLLVVDC